MYIYFDMCVYIYIYYQSIRIINPSQFQDKTPPVLSSQVPPTAASSFTGGMCAIGDDVATLAEHAAAGIRVGVDGVAHGGAEAAPDLDDAKKGDGKNHEWMEDNGKNEKKTKFGKNESIVPKCWNILSSDATRACQKDVWTS